jgi:lipopolysaccharide transport system permease protein
MHTARSVKPCMVVRSHRCVWQLEWAELWQYRDLLMLMVKRDFAAKYRQTVLGPLWFMIQPLLMTGVFTIIFSHIARISTHGIPPALFYLCGLMGWNYLSQIVTMASTTFITQADVFQKVYFPRLVVPLSMVVSNLILFGIQCVLFLGLYAFFYFQNESGLSAPQLKWLLCPFLVIHLGFIGLGFSLIASALTARYRDLNYLIPVMIQLWMYATPIIYPLASVPQKYDWLMLINPAVAPIEGLKSIFLQAGALTLQHYILSCVITFVLCLGGLLLFKKAELHASDTA